MTKKEIENTRQRISGYIDQHRLSDALTEIKDIAHKQSVWMVEDKINQIQENYAYMLRYLTDGANDPERQNVYYGLINDAYTQLDNLLSSIESIDSAMLYFNHLRYLKLQKRSDILRTLTDRLYALSDKLSLFSLVTGTPDSDQTKERKEMERVQSDMFMYLWVIPQLSNEDTELTKQLLESPNIKPEIKQHLLSAVTLGQLQQFDAKRMQLLMSTYLYAEDMRVSSAALVGMLLGLWRYSNRPLPQKLKNMLMAVKDKEGWSSDLRIAFIEMIRARDTERINRKMRDEVIPKMEKLRPDMINKFNKATQESDDPMSLQENPEWQDLLDKSGITDQLKELTEIQMEGGDVMMSTFAHLKQFPFFQNISNWFLPFDAQHTSVTSIMGQLDVVGEIMENARFICDNDKYSFMFALESVPTNQKEMMLSQLKSQTEGLYEAMNNVTANRGPESRRMAVNMYMQNIYRFFKLFNRKSEFFDPFDQGINLIRVPSLADDFDDQEMLQVVAEFYFKLKYMRDALEVYTRLEQLGHGDASRYQKIGYCNERLGNYPEAIANYKKAELLDTKSAWTIKRLAVCHRNIGDKSTALEYYKQLALLLPDDMHSALLYGQSLLENGDYANALSEFYKVEFLDEKSRQVLRPLAWTLFLTGDFERARQYYDRIIADSPNATDYINKGHVELATGNIRTAVDDYANALRLSPSGEDWLRRTVNSDMEAMSQVGIDLNLVPLVIDAAYLKRNEN